MAVNLSPIGGVAAQFLDNSGNPLTGGKIFTYAAGTTTPQATYTSSNGATPHANPIILDAAGRVPGGEIWLTDGLQYKFLIKTSTDVQIGSYDNIIGINSNFVNYTNSQEIQTATAGQTVFTLTTMAYQPGTNSLSVFVDGVNQYGPGSMYAFQETSDTVVTFTSGLHVGAEVKFTTSAINASSYGDAEQISYTPPFTNSVPTNVEAKLAQTVSVKDFGAVGDGMADDTAAVQAAVNSGEYGVYVPNGTYIVDSVTGSDIYLFGSGTIKKKSATKGEMLYLTGDNVVEGITLDYDWMSADQSLPYSTNISLRQDQGSIAVRNCKFIRSFARALYVEGATLMLSNSSFSEGAPHNNQSGGNERVTSYVDIQADLLTDEQFVEITGNSFVGPSLVTADLHLNTTGILLNAQALDGVRYKSVNITGNTLIACSQNAGAGNVTGAIDTYNGVENLVVSGNTIRLYSYAGIKIQNSSNFAVTGNIVTGGAVPSGSAVAQSQGIITNEKVRGATAEQLNGTITANVIQDCQYVGINNSCDNVTISSNIIDGVILATLGTAIFNSASYVNITANIGRNIEGLFIDTTGGDNVKVIGNTLQSDTVASPGAVSYTGANLDISHNTFVSSLASGGSGIRTNGPAANVKMIGNFVDGYPYGLDFRTTGGAVNNVNITDNQFANISTSAINITSAVTNAFVDLNTFSLVTATYDPPSLAVGNASPVQTVTVTGAALGNNVIATGARDMLGLYVVAWVSAADTVSWYVLNPTGNPNGTQNLGSTTFNFCVQKMS